MNKEKAKQDSYVLKNINCEFWIQQMVKHPNIAQLYETLETKKKKPLLRGDGAIYALVATSWTNLGLKETK